MSYPGGKSGAGVYQTIINQIPPHEVYIEPFVGGGGVLRHKTPATSSIAIDSDSAAVQSLMSLAIPGLTVICGDARSFLMLRCWRGDEFVYCDPPYLMSTRRSGRAIYREELMSDDEHRDLVSLLMALPARVMISGYGSRLYDDMLAGWRRVEYTAQTRGGPATEVLWMNYAEPASLADHRYLGANYRERERIKRREARWVRRLRAMPSQERAALASAIAEVDGEPSGIGSPAPEDAAQESRKGACAS